VSDDFGDMELETIHWQNYAREKAEALAELETVRGLLRALMAPASYRGMVCPWCKSVAHMGRGGFELYIDDHAADCPWRQAREYVDGLEAKNE
jgi:hypothetical protein